MTISRIMLATIISGATGGLASLGCDYGGFLRSKEGKAGSKGPDGVPLSADTAEAMAGEQTSNGRVTVLLNGILTGTV